jgi:hypothetical protein
VVLISRRLGVVLLLLRLLLPPLMLLLILPPPPPLLLLLLLSVVVISVVCSSLQGAAALTPLNGQCRRVLPVFCLLLLCLCRSDIGSLR